MQSRASSILEAAIKEFIATGQPISSGLLYKKYDFGIKPASIRAELNRLSDDGFLTQPHTSAGRVPTDKGYQFLVEKLLEELEEKEIAKEAPAVPPTKPLNRFVVELAEDLGVLGVGYEPEEGEVYKSGLHGIFAGLDMLTQREVFEITRDFDLLDERMDRLLNHLTGDLPSVFIGRSPITTSRHLSVIANIYQKGGDEIVLVAIGPKRMNYRKVIHLFKSLNHGK